MDDKNLMENILMLQKGVCDLFMHGSIESSTPEVHQTFNTALNDSLRMQNSIYDRMSENGWYPTEKVDQQKISTVKQKFSAQLA
ncbi:MAG: spore coat protein [Clostridia bacterium]|nr:spore coat protein [Clostridia bacterium]